MPLFEKKYTHIVKTHQRVLINPPPFVAMDTLGVSGREEDSFNATSICNLLSRLHSCHRWHCRFGSAFQFLDLR